MSSYGMFSKKGSEKVSDLVKQAENAPSRAEAVKVLNDGIKRIAGNKKFGEVRDTDVREQIAYALDSRFDKNGWDRLSIFEF